jgi:hypothetical protein
MIKYSIKINNNNNLNTEEVYENKLDLCYHFVGGLVIGDHCPINAYPFS